MLSCLDSLTAYSSFFFLTVNHKTRLPGSDQQISCSCAVEKTQLGFPTETRVVQRDGGCWWIERRKWIFGGESSAKIFMAKDTELPPFVAAHNTEFHFYVQLNCYPIWQTTHPLFFWTSCILSSTSWYRRSSITWSCGLWKPGSNTYLVTNF
jgi:hypothetical protein